MFVPPASELSTHAQASDHNTIFEQTDMDIDPPPHCNSHEFLHDPDFHARILIASN